ncbi:MAG: response regulator [Ilumatobacteraceae bacterium]
MSSPERPDDEPGPASVRVLLADDDADQRLAVRALLRQRGFADVTDAVDGEDAVRAARRQPPHLILLDLAMPVRSGAEVLPELRDAAPDAAIVVLSNLPRRRLLGRSSSGGGRVRREVGGADVSSTRSWWRRRSPPARPYARAHHSSPALGGRGGSPVRSQPPG